MVINKAFLNMSLMTLLTIFASLHVWVLFDVGFVFTGTELSLLVAGLLFLVNFKSGISKSFLQFILFYLLLQLLNIVSILFSDSADNLNHSFALVFKNIVYLVLPVGIYMGMKHSKPIVYRNLFIVFLCAFVLAVFYYGIQRSVDFSLFLSFFLGGSFSEVQYGVFHKLFADYRLVRYESASASAFRHGILYLVLCTFLISKFYSVDSHRVLRLDHRDLIIMLLSILFLSRQVLVCTFFYYLLLILFYQKNIYFRAMFIAFIVAVIIFFVSGFNVTINENVYEKLIYDVLNNPRLIDFSIALSDFSDRVAIGVGYGVTLPSGSYAHNLVINQLHQTGILGGVLAIFLVVHLISVCFNSIFLFIKYYYSAHLILACLVSIPILKMLVGVAGNLDFASWFAIGIVFFIKERADGYVKYQRG